MMAATLGCCVKTFLPGMQIHLDSELGTEKLCLACREYWPADREFFAHAASKDGLSTRCLACIKARVWRLERHQHACNYSRPARCAGSAMKESAGGG